MEIGPVKDDMDFSRIMEKSIKKEQTKPEATVKQKPREKLPPPDFVDDDEVPPLEWILEHKNHNIGRHESDQGVNKLYNKHNLLK